MSAPALAAVRDASYRDPAPAHPITIALLGFGEIGSAVARCAERDRASSPWPIHVAGALVRDIERPRAIDVNLTRDVDRLFAARPDVIVEVLGGTEPARTLVRAALERGLPVVTANKTLLAYHGEELLDVAARTGAPLRYEASVLAGVPFLGMFAARPRAARVSALAGILNGTSNFILSRVAATGATLADATSEARQRGLAEPDPSRDLCGADAADKLAVLAWHFGLGSILPDAFETTGIAAINGDDVAMAHELGGVIKAVACLEQKSARITAFVGPALVPRAHRLAAVNGADNALLLETESGPLFFSGPGAGPIPTATTILDDVVEAARGAQSSPRRHPRRPVAVTSPVTPWMLRLTGDALSGHEDEAIAAFLGSHGVWSRRSLARGQTTWLLTYPCGRERIHAALRAVSLATGCQAFAIRALED